VIPIHVPAIPRTRGERVCAFIEHFCCVPEGTLVGKPMRLEPFQRRWILDVYDNPHGTRTAILSIGRKNGKTPLIAALVLCHVAGPEARQNSQIVSGAMSQKQAATVFKYAHKMVMFSPKLQALVRVRPSLKQIVGLAMNVEYAAISRQKKTAQGLAPVLAIVDELGQVRGEQDDFYDALDTALGAYTDAMLFIISTQAASDSDLLSRLIDDYAENKDPHTVCHVYAAEDPDCDVMDQEAWRQSNPALGIFRSEKDLRELAEKAKRMPSFENGFRNLNLNQRCETSSPLIPHGVWLANSFEPNRKAFLKGTVFGGLDLSARLDLTAFVLTTFWDERWHVLPFFWTPAEGVEERARRDKQPYPKWIRAGLLRTTPGRSIDYGEVARQVREEIVGMYVAGIAFDRWRMESFKKECERNAIDLPGLVPHGQGFRDMAPSIDALESALANDTMSHGNHPVLTMCASNAVAVKDEANNRKLDKKRASGRIDGIVALTMAIGIATRQEEEGDLGAFLANPVTSR
jgi:phage terminase large subunit-like protein